MPPDAADSATASSPLFAWSILLGAFIIACIWIYQRGRLRPRSYLTATLNENPITWTVAEPIFILLLMAWIVQFLIGQALALLIHSGSVTLSPETLTMVGIILPVLIQIFMLVMLSTRLKEMGLSLKQAFHQNTSSGFIRFGTALACLVLVYPITYAAAEGSALVLETLGFLPSEQLSIQFFRGDQTTVAKTSLLFQAALLAPVAEELFFRGLLLPIIAQKLGFIRGIIYSSLLFALVHFHIFSILPLFALSIYFSLAYCMTRSIMVPIFMHILFNVFNLGLFIYADSIANS